ncbi:DUF3226 domain-containing protein [Chamaesiphon sp. GL140_3_metabinner_50]|uniref:DUF3226 domain-containing protein n=1 Tax=Chamaesiphon sp. GL140_3_metabinner_50 TaxID=2970812 RepID=UPI0025F6F073|nr:DUF3226 domain-containing protein [Chamaesiphon sp. GL140_3_metabinner_50]
MGRNILIVESNNDKYFFQSVIKHLDIDLEVAAPVFLDEDYRAMDGSDSTKLINALKDLKADIQKEDIERIGIILDVDRHSEAERIKFINDCIIKVFPKAITLDRANQFTDLNFEAYPIKLACYFTNVNGQGELETVLKVIKNQDSTYADCLDRWRECLVSNGKKITDKKFDKLWIVNYIRYDTATKDEQKHADRKLTLNYALENKSFIWNLDHPILAELKVFFRLFNNSSS